MSSSATPNCRQRGLIAGLTLVTFATAITAAAAVAVASGDVSDNQQQRPAQQLTVDD